MNKYIDYPMDKNNIDSLEIAVSGTYVFHFCDNIVGEKRISLAENVEANILFVLHGADIKIPIHMMWKNASLQCAAIVLSSWGIVTSIDFDVFLDATETKTDIYALSLLWNKADAKVTWGVVLWPNAVKSAGFLLEENLLLWKKIRIHTLPKLDVHTNDVQASHGATIDRLDENTLFYLSAKGISRQQAEQLMIQSYIQKALDLVWVEDKTILSYVFDNLARG